jgi:phosphoribosylformimino-5-aminoimidazole carboxamide ribotide isomerase
MIIPAIDILNESVVRLYQGDFEQTTDYSKTVIELFQAYEQQGAQRIHLVDLSRAKNPNLGPSKAIQQALQQAKAPVQVGGGIRTEQDLSEWLSLGAKQVVIGSIAVTDPYKVSQWIQRLGAEVFVLSLDVKWDSIEQDFYPYIQGWQQRVRQNLNSILTDYYSLGIRNLLCTDIQVDGTLQGSNQQLYQQLTQLFPELNVQASGGVGKLTDIAAVKQTGVAGLIIGKALLENRFSLPQAIECWDSAKAPSSKHRKSLGQSQQEQRYAR